MRNPTATTAARDPGPPASPDWREFKAFLGVFLPILAAFRGSIQSDAAQSKAVRSAKWPPPPPYLQ
jgi:hypothetical protein